MFKYLHLSLTLLLGLVSAGVSAQSPQPSKDGYFRIVNANNRADGKRYVYVTGAYAAMPNATKAEATTLPGTVIHLKMVPIQVFMMCKLCAHRVLMSLMDI